MPLPTPRTRVLLTAALPALLVLALLAGFLLLVHPAGTTNASSATHDPGTASTSVGGGGSSTARPRSAPAVPQAIDSVPTISASPQPVDNGVDGRHPRAKHRRPSAAARDADLARWIAAGRVAAPTSSDLRPVTGSSDTGATSSSDSAATTGDVTGSTG